MNKTIGEEKKCINSVLYSFYLHFTFCPKWCGYSVLKPKMFENEQIYS